MLSHSLLPCLAVKNSGVRLGVCKLKKNVEGRILQVAGRINPVGRSLLAPDAMAFYLYELIFRQHVLLETPYWASTTVAGGQCDFFHM